jgi:hypothetical protein
MLMWHCREISLTRHERFLEFAHDPQSSPQRKRYALEARHGKTIACVNKVQVGV